MSDKGGDSSDSASSQTPAQWAAAQSNTSIAAWKENDILSFSVAQLRALTTAQVSQITVPWAIPGAAWTADTLNAVPVQYWGAFGPRYLSTTINGRVTVQTLSQYNGVSSGVASGISNWFGDLGYSCQSSTGSWVFSPSVIAGISNDRIAAIGSGLGTASHAPTLGANNTVVDAHAFESALNAATSSGEHMTTWNISVSSSDQSAGISKRSVVMFGAGWADMGAVFMSALTSSQLGAIAHPEAVLTAVQFGAFSANQLIALRQMDWSRVTAAQLNAITLEAFSGLQTNIIAAISASAWGGLDQAHTQKLNATDISLLSASSIAALKYLGYALTASVAGVLTASQVASISDSCWAQLSDTNFLNALPLTVMQSIAPSAFARMSSAVIASMDSLHLGALTNAQSLVFPVNELSNASALFYRNPNTLNFNDFVNNPSVNWSQAPASFIRLLTLAQLKLLQPSQIGQLSLAAIAGFTRSQTQALTLAQIQAWRPAQLSAALYMSRRVDVVAEIFTVSTVTQISPAFWGRVDSNFLNALSLDAFRALTSTQIEAISTDAFAGIDQAHFEAFTITQLLALTAGQVGSFRGEYLSIFFLRNIRLVSFKGLVPEQMHRLHDYLFNTVATNAFATADPVLLATAEHQFATLLASILESDDGREAWLQQSVNLLIRLNWLDPVAASTLSASDVQSIYSALNWAWMSGTFLNSIMVSVFAQIRASSIAQLNLSALAALDSAHIQALTVTQAAGLSGEQLSAIANLGALQASVVQSLTASQLVGITTDWSTISTTFLNNMTAWQFAALTPAQFGQLTAAQLLDTNNHIAWLLLSAADWNALSLDTFAQLCTGDSPPILEASSEALLGLSGEQMAALAQASRFYNETQRRQLLSGLFGSFNSDQAQNLLDLLSLDEMDQIVLQVGLVNLMAKVDGTTFGVDNAIAALAMLRQTQASFIHADNLSLVLVSLSASSIQEKQNIGISNVLLTNSLISRGNGIASLLRCKNNLGSIYVNQLTAIHDAVKTSFVDNAIGGINISDILSRGSAHNIGRNVNFLFDSLIEEQFQNANPGTLRQIEQIRERVLTGITNDATRQLGNTEQPPLVVLGRLSPAELAAYVKNKVIQVTDDFYADQFERYVQGNDKLTAVSSAATTSLALVGLLVAVGASINAFGAAAYAAVDKHLTAKERQNLVTASVLGGLAYAAQGLLLPVTLIMQAIVQKATGQQYVDSPSYLDAVWQKFTEGFKALRNAGAIETMRNRLANGQDLPDGGGQQFYIEDPIGTKPVFLSYEADASGGFAHLLVQNHLGIDKTAVATFNADGTLNNVTDLVEKRLQPSAETIADLQAIVQAARAKGKNISRMLISLDSGSAGLGDNSLNARLDSIAGSRETPLPNSIQLLTDNVQRFVYRAVKEQGIIDPQLGFSEMVLEARQLLEARGVTVSKLVANDVTRIVLQIQAGQEPDFQVRASILNILKAGNPHQAIGEVSVLDDPAIVYNTLHTLGYNGDFAQATADMAGINDSYVLKALTDKFNQGGYDDLFQAYSDQIERSAGAANDWSIFHDALQADLATMGVKNISTADPSFTILLKNLQATALTEIESPSLYNDVRVLDLQNNDIILRDLARSVGANYNARLNNEKSWDTDTAEQLYQFVMETYANAAPSKLEDRAFSRTLVQAMLEHLPSSDAPEVSSVRLLRELTQALDRTGSLNKIIGETFAQGGVSRVEYAELDRVLVFDNDIVLPALLEHLQKVNPNRHAHLTTDSPEFKDSFLINEFDTHAFPALQEAFQGGNQDSLELFGVPYRSIYTVKPVGGVGNVNYVPGVLKPEIAQTVQTVLRNQLHRVVNEATAQATILYDKVDGTPISVVGRSVYNAIDASMPDGNTARLSTLWNTLDAAFTSAINCRVGQWSGGFSETPDLDQATKDFAASTEPLTGLNANATAAEAIEKFRVSYVEYALRSIAAPEAGLSSPLIVQRAGQVIRALGGNPANYGALLNQLVPTSTSAPIVQQPVRESIPTILLPEDASLVRGAPQRAVPVLDDNPLSTTVFDALESRIERYLRHTAVKDTYVNTAQLGAKTGRFGFPDSAYPDASPQDLEFKLNFLVDVAQKFSAQESVAEVALSTVGQQGFRSTQEINAASTIAIVEAKQRYTQLLDYLISSAELTLGLTPAFKYAYKKAGGAASLLTSHTLDRLVEPIQRGISAVRTQNQPPTTRLYGNVGGPVTDTLDGALGDPNVRGVLNSATSATSATASAPTTQIKAVLEVATPDELGRKLMRRLANLVQRELPGADPFDGLQVVLEQGIYRASLQQTIQEWAKQYGVGVDRATGRLNRSVMLTGDVVKQVLKTTYAPDSPLQATIENTVVKLGLVNQILRLPAERGGLPVIAQESIIAGKASNSALLGRIVELVLGSYAPKTVVDFVEPLRGLVSRAGTVDPFFSEVLVNFARQYGLAIGETGERPNYQFSFTEDDIIQAIQDALSAGSVAKPLDEIQQEFAQPGIREAIREITFDLNSSQLFARASLPAQASAATPNLNALVRGSENVAAYTSADVIDEHFSGQLAKVFTDYAVHKLFAVQMTHAGLSPEAVVTELLSGLVNDFSAFYDDARPIPDELKANIRNFMIQNGIGIAVDGKLNVGLKVSGDMLLSAMAQSIREQVAPATSNPAFKAIASARDIQQLIINIKTKPGLFFKEGVPPPWFNVLSSGAEYPAAHINNMVTVKAWSSLPDASILKQQSLAEILFKYQIERNIYDNTEASTIDGAPLRAGALRQQLLFDVQTLLSKQPLPADLVTELKAFATKNKIAVLTDAQGGQRLNSNLTLDFDVLGNALIKVLQDTGQLATDEISGIRAQELIPKLFELKVFDSGSSPKEVSLQTKLTYPENQRVLESFSAIGQAVPDLLRTNVTLPEASTITTAPIARQSVTSPLRAQELGLILAKTTVSEINQRWMARHPTKEPTAALLLAEVNRVLEAEPTVDPVAKALDEQVIPEFLAAYQQELQHNGKNFITRDGVTLDLSPAIYARAVGEVLAETSLYSHTTHVNLGVERGLGGSGVYASLNAVQGWQGAGGATIETVAYRGAGILENARDTGIVAVSDIQIVVPETRTPLDVAVETGDRVAFVEAVPGETAKAKFTRLSLAGQGFAQLGFALFASIVGIAAGIAGIIYAAQSKTLSSSAKILTITMNVVRVFTSVTILVGSGAQIASSVIKAVSIATDVTKVAEASFAIGNVVGIATSAAQFLLQIQDIANTTATGRSLLIQRLAIVDTTIQLLLALVGTLALIGGSVGIVISVIILLVSSLIPSMAAITSAITYHESYTSLKGQGLYNEAQVMFVYYQSAALDATPIVNWTSSIYTPEIKKAQEKLMDYAWMDQSAEQRLFYSITSNSAFKDNFDGVRDQTYAAAAALTQPLVNLSQGLTRAVTLMLSQDNLSYFEGDKVATVKLAATSNYLTNTVVRAPKLINATVSGTTVTLAFNQNLASLNSQLPDLSTFTVRVNGVVATLKGFALSGNTATLVLNTAVTAGQVVTFSYSDPTAGDDQHALQAITGKDFASVSNHAVINLLDTDTRAPQLVDAVVQDKYLTLVFDEVLNSTSDHAPTAGEFTVSLTDANGTVTTPQILGINVSDYRVLLTLVNSVASGDVVSVTYTPAASGTKLLQDTANNKVAGFTSGSAGVVSVVNTAAVSTIVASRAGWLQYDNFVSSLQGTGTEAASVLNGSDYTVYASESAASSGTARLRYLSLSNMAGEFDMYAASRTNTTNDTIWLDASSALGTVSFAVNVNDMTVWGGQGYNSYSLSRSYANSANRIVAANSWSANSNIVSIAGSSSDSNMTVNLDNLLTTENISAGLPAGQSVFKVLGANDGLDVVVGTADSQSYFATTNVANINLSGANANVLVGEASQVKVGVNGRVQVDMDMWRGLSLPAPTIPSSGTTGVVTGGYGSYSLLNFAATDSIDTSFEGKLDMIYQIGHLPALDAWTVNVGGALVNVASMKVSGNKVTLNLASAVQQNQTVSVGYKDLSTGNDLETLQDLVGNDVASFSAQAVVNVTADTKPPALVVATAQGNSLILHFSEILNQAYKPLSTAFTVLVNNVPTLVSKVTFNDSTSLRLTLNSAVPAGQTVSVGYNVPSDNMISAQDLAGNKLSGFVANPVVNLANVTHAPNLRGVSVNDNVLTLTFDSTVRYTLSDASAFLVTVNNAPVSVSSVSVAGNSVLLYLSSAVTNNQLVEVSYTPPQQMSDATTLRDWLGNSVSGWGTQVANNISGEDLTPPTLQYAIANGNSVVLTFSEALDSRAGFIASANVFAVQVNTQSVLVTQVAVSGASVTLSLASTINYGDAVTLAYTDVSRANDVAVVQDLAGNDVASFSGVNVVNKSPDTTPPTLVSATVTGDLCKNQPKPRHHEVF